MIVKIKLTKAQVNGIREYLKVVDGIDNPTQKDIQSEIANICNGTFQNPHVNLSEYVQKHEKLLNKLPDYKKA